MRYAALVLACLLIPTAAATHQPCPPEDCPVLLPAPDVPYLEGPVTLLSFGANVRVTSGIATTAIEMQFQANTTGEAILNLPMPGGASLLGFNLTVGNKTLAGRVEEIGQARQDYTEAKEAGKDAVLLESAGERLVRLRVAVPAGEVRTLRAAYAEIVPRAAGSRVYHLPLSQLVATGHLVLDFSIATDVTGLRFVGPKLVRTASSGHFEGSGPSADFTAVWSEPGSGWSASLVASRSGAAEWVAQVCRQSSQVLPRDVVFVLDDSGSMSGAKIQEARESLRSVLQGLDSDDRYDVVIFNDDVTTFHAALVKGPGSATDQSRASLVQAGGGTDIDAGLQTALRELAAARGSDGLPMVVFITDGLPSSGVTDHHQIIERFRAANSRDASIQVVPIGLDADRTFLADLALQSGGMFTPIDPTEAPVALRLERLYDVVGHPLVRNVSVNVTGLAGLEAFPTALPPIYEDGCLVLYLRGTPTGSTVSITVSGLAIADGGTAPTPVTQRFDFPIAAVPIDPAAERVWAAAHIDTLLSRERVGGPNATLRAQIVAEAVQMRQLTPYTAWVITEVAAAPEPQSVADLCTGCSAAGAGGRQGAPAPYPKATGTYAAGTGSQWAHDASGSGGAPTSPPTTPGFPLLVALGVLVVVAAMRRRIRS